MDLLMRLSHLLLQPRLRSDVFRTSGKFPRKLSTKTLYDLLCVRPDDDAETLQSAFRDAAKAHHPDLNPGDPDAPGRFRQIVTAYRILRDARQRGAYDSLLAVERARRRAKLMRTVADAVAIVALTVVVVGGYRLFADASKTSVEATKLAEFAERWPTEIPVVEPAAPTDMSRGEPSGKSTRVELADAPIVPNADAPEAKSDEPLIIANGGPASDSSGSNSEVAKAVDALDARIDRGETTNGADHHKKNDEFNSLDQNGVRAVEPHFSSPEKDKSPSSKLAIFDRKHYMIAKLPGHAKRPETDRASVRRAALEIRNISQVALESRNTSPCASSCSDRAPPLFGVGP